MVASVGYPELESHPDHALARRLLPRGCGSVFSFDLRGSREQGRAFIEALKIFSHLANVGDCRSLVIHPASTTHFRMDDAALARGRHRPGHDPPLDRPRGRRRPDRRPEARAEGGGARRRRAAMKLDVVLPDGPREAYAYTGGKPFDAQPARASCSSTARCTTTASGRCSARWFAHHGHARARARPAGPRAQRRRRRWRASRRWPTGCSRCSTPPACSAPRWSATAWGR